MIIKCGPGLTTAPLPSTRPDRGPGGGDEDTILSSKGPLSLTGLP